jgi:hydroxyethylthiazole kinase-like uncharacterized protein yjeF
MMEEFSWQYPDDFISDTLSEMIIGRGAFRRFRDTVKRFEIEKEWHAWRTQAHLDIAKEWCEENDIAYLVRNKKINNAINIPTLQNEDKADNVTEFPKEKLVTAAEMKALDAYTIQEIGVPSMVLMERAALAAVDVLYEKHFDLTKVLCICGTGNNGGDGLAVARLLHLKGIRVQALLIGNSAKLTPETKQQMEIARNCGVRVTATESDVSPIREKHTTIVDALLGIGGSRPLDGIYYDAVLLQHATQANILAIDIPSGISADTGEVLGIAVPATATVTFAFNKIGLTIPPGRDYAGDVIVKDIGILAGRKL